MPRPLVLNLGHESKSPGGLIKMKALSLSDSVGLGVGPENVHV